MDAPPNKPKRIGRRWSTIDTRNIYHKKTAVAAAQANPSLTAPASTATGTRAKAVVHDTEVVTAIKDLTALPSHQADIADLERNAAAAAAVADSTLPQLNSSTSAYDDCLREKLSQAVFVGHINTDLDSVAGAIAAATLFGGTPALAEPFEKLNGEIIFALNHTNTEPPAFFGDLPNVDSFDVCLVDHTEETQMVGLLRNSANRCDRVVGVIDHHALSKSFSSTRPVFMDLRPWGSMCTIVGYLFLVHRQPLPKPLAVLMLQAILSDTLNLRSITTTEADRSMVALLTAWSGIGHPSGRQPSLSSNDLYVDEAIDILAKQQFQAKTSWIVALGPYEMVRGDQKDFACGPWKFGVSVLEVTDTTQVMTCSAQILSELRLLKKEKGLVAVTDQDGAADSETSFKLARTQELDFAFLFVVNVVDQTSILLISGGRELALAKAAFLENDDINADGTVTLQKACPGIRAPGSTIHPGETAMLLPTGYVSRKAQFVPAFFKAIQDFEYDSKGPRSQEHEEDEIVSEMRAAQVQEKVQQSKFAEVPKPSQRHSSFRQSLSSSAMGLLVSREGVCDDELVRANELAAKDRHGNLYDDNGRVIRTYDYE